MFGQILNNTPSIVVTPTNTPANYTVTVTDANNCSLMRWQQLQLMLYQLYQLHLLQFAGNSATLTASGASSFAWNTGETTTSIVVTPTMSPMDYTVTGTDGNLFC